MNETWVEIEERHAEARQSYFDQHIAEGDISGALALCGSEEVARAIVELAPSLSDDQLREVLVDEWTRCEAHKPHRDDFVRLFRQVGFVTDVDEQDENYPARIAAKDNRHLIAIYRGNAGEREPSGISWTLSRETAEFFAGHSFSVRGKFLGIYNPDGTPTVWRATVPLAGVLAYFDGRTEKEVVVDPATLSNVRRIAEARKENQ